jgi:hypothetical protein
MGHKNDGGGDSESPSGSGLKRKEYEGLLKKLHVELVKLQEWVRHKGFQVRARSLLKGRGA